MRRTDSRCSASSEADSPSCPACCAACQPDPGLAGRLKPEQRPGTSTVRARFGGTASVRIVRTCTPPPAPGSRAPPALNSFDFEHLTLRYGNVTPPVHLQQRLAVGHHLRLREEGVAVHRHCVTLDAEVAAQLHVEADLQGAPAVKSHCCPRGGGIIAVVRQMLQCPPSSTLKP